MQKALLYFFAGTIISFLLNYFLLGSQGWELDLFYAFSFGSGWGIAYLLDDVKFSLGQKFLVSFASMGILGLAGVLLFNLEFAVPAIIKFSTIFVAYYLLASFRRSKSLRS